MLAPVEEREPNDSLSFTLFNPRAGTKFPLIRPGYKYGFLFDFTIPVDDASNPAARPAAEFIDDADLNWEIDADLRLRQMRAPREPWRELMPPYPG